MSNNDLLEPGNQQADDGLAHLRSDGADLLSAQPITPIQPLKFEPAPSGVVVEGPPEEIPELVASQGITFREPEDLPDGIELEESPEPPESFMSIPLERFEGSPPVPGMRRRPPALLQHPEEREAALKVLLAHELEAAIDPAHLILEFGPLRKLEAAMRTVSRDFAHADVAEAVMAHVRHAMHDAVVANPQLGEKDNSEAGLHARIAALDLLEKDFESDVEPVISRIEQTGLNLTDLRQALRAAITGEHRRLQTLSKTLAPATLGNRIFDGLVDLKDKLTLGGKDHLVGDARRHRNEHLQKTLGSLAEVTAELRHRAGDAEWEKTSGPMAARLAHDLIDTVQDLTKDVEDQVDHHALNRSLDACKTDIAEAAKSSVDEDHKGRLERMLEFVKRAIDAIAAALGKVFGSDNTPAAQSPAKFTPA